MKNSLPFKKFRFGVFVVFGAFLFWSLLWSTPSRAQFEIPGATPAQFEIDPRYPFPEQSFTVRIGDYGGTIGGAVSWYIDGLLQESEKNKPSISLIAPRTGTPLHIEVRGENGVRIQTTIVPSELDIIIEGKTLAPYFYKGRRTPGIGTDVRITVIPQLYDKKGKHIPANKITYSWNVDNALVENGGKPVLELSLSRLGSPLILLSASAPEYETFFETVFYVPTQEPSLAFYIQNPLTGLSRNAVQESYLRATNEVSVRAESYSIGENVYRNAQYGWSINGTRVQDTGSAPQNITLRKQGGGVAHLIFHFHYEISLRSPSMHKDFLG